MDNYNQNAGNNKTQKWKASLRLFSFETQELPHKLLRTIWPPDLICPLFTPGANKTSIITQAPSRCLEALAGVKVANTW